MSAPVFKTMRDVCIHRIHQAMRRNKKIFFLSADFGSPALDALRKEHPRRFINVGIAEQNLINLATGLGLEGFIVYAYAIAPFLVMRPYEQIRINLSILAALRRLNVNLLGVGVGLSYDVSGFTHHCFEDSGIMRMLPHLEVISPSDTVLAQRFLDYTLSHDGPKYLRLDGKPLPVIYARQPVTLTDGFAELKKGRQVVLIATGYMTHKALKVSELLQKNGIPAGVIDMFLLKYFNEAKLVAALKKYQHVVTIEEGFIGKGGLDTLIVSLISRRHLDCSFQAFGFGDAYVDEIGSRQHLHALHRLDEQSIMKAVIREVKGRDGRAR